MTMYALVSAGGSPGVTTAALALALTWPGKVIVAETDPGGAAVLAGLFAGHVDGSRNLRNVAYEALTADTAAAEIPRQLVNLDPTGTRMLLPGLADPRHVTAIDPAWPVLAAALAASSSTVLADCGRLDGGPSQAAVVTAADRIVLIMRPTLRQVAAARPRMQMLTDTSGIAAPVSLLLAGPGPLDAGEITRLLGTRITGTLPNDAKTAAVLSDGDGRRTALQNSPLMRAAVAVGKALRGQAEAQAHGTTVPSDLIGQP